MHPSWMKSERFDDLEISIDLIGYMVYLEQRGVPRKFEGEEFVGLLNKRISKLESVRSSIEGKTSTKKADMLLEKADDLVEKIKTIYY